MIRMMAAMMVLVAVCLAVCPAADVNVQNIPGAEFKPGQLKLPLIVTERSGVERQAAVVSSGVPFPQGFLPDVTRLAVVDKDGKAVVSQASLMVKWHKPVFDDSVQWALVSFVTDCASNGTALYYLTDDGKATPPASPLKLVQSDKDIAIDTGAAKFVVPLEGEALLASATVGGKNVLGPKGLQSIITTGEWTNRNLTAGDKQVAAHTATDVAVEESGPARVVVAVKGQFKPGDKDGKFYRATTRLYFDVGSASVRVVHTIANSQLDPKLEGGWRYIYTWPIEDASLVADLALGDAVTVATTAEDKRVESAKDLLVHQDSSGGERWQYPAGPGKGKPIGGVTFRGYKVTEAGQEVAAGNVHPGAMSVAAGKLGVAATLRNFQLECPHALAGSAKNLRVGLFPGEFGEPFPINGGQRKSWDVRLTFFAAGAPDPAKEVAVQTTLFLFRPEAAWMARTAAAGCWPYGLGMVKDPRAGKYAPRRDTSKLDGGATGWDRYGMVGDWNSGGHHWNEESKYMPWILWGDGADFDAVEAGSLWCSDLVPFNYEVADIAPFYLMLMGWNDHENRIKRVAYPGWRNHDGWGNPDSGHCGMLVVPDYYYLTGDRRAREAVEHVGNIARAMLWKWNHDDKKDGGPAGYAIPWCKKKDADADPNFKLDTRYVGWPLFNLANAYRLTGDPEALADCRNVAHAFRNTARWSPIGFLTLQVEPKGGTKSLYAFQGPFQKYRDLSASQCYAHFQAALMVHGLFEYYTMSRDIEALDPMIGFADLMCHHAMIKDPEGKRKGWTYAFGDYWGPYNWEDSGKGKGQRAAWSDWHYNVVESLGWIAQFTGRADYVDTLKDAVAAYGKAPAFDAAAAIMATEHPHADQPPAAIADLKAEATGGGTVKLTWTAPAGTSPAARYQVKYSTAKIVERVTGWPDRTEPLPQDAKEWAARAAAFNAQQRAFWAAINLPDAPTPAAAGKAESMEVKGLPVGNLNFAVKSWTAGDTMSELSNVVSVEVK